MGKISKEARKIRKKAAKKAAWPALWEECRRKYSLDEEDIRKAREIGMVPEGIINLPVVPAEKWKMPVRQWIGYLYEKRQEKLERKARSKARWQRRQEMI